MSISSSIIIGIFTPRELLDPCHLRVIGDLDTHEQTVDCGQRITEKNIGGLGRRGGGWDVQDQTKLEIMFSGPASLPLERCDGLDLASAKLDWIWPSELTHSAITHAVCSRSLIIR